MSNEDLINSIKNRKIAAQMQNTALPVAVVNESPEAESKIEAYREEGKRRAGERKTLDEQAAIKKTKKYSTSVSLTGEMIDKYSELRAQFRPYGCITYEKIIFGGLKYLERMTEQERCDFMAQFNEK